MTNRLPALFLGHGSPMTMIGDNPDRAGLAALGRLLPRPTAILCVSAHWETQGTTHVTAGPAPRTIHDFRGFPAELYAMQYPAPGSDWLLGRIEQLLGPGQVTRDESWGFDHGTWGVLLPLFSDAQIPTVEMSLDRSLTPEQHLALGRKLAVLRDEGVLIVGSGNVVHNLSLWRESQGTQPEWSVDLQGRVTAAVETGDDTALTSFAPDDRSAALAINSGEHYLPLLYAVGARLPGDEIAVVNDRVDGALSMTSYVIGAQALNRAAAA